MTKKFYEVCFTYKIDLPFKEARKLLIKSLNDVEWYIELKKKKKNALKRVSEEKARFNEANAKGAKVTASNAQKALKGYEKQYAEATEKLDACNISKGSACPENFWFALRIDPERQVQPAFPDCFNAPCADNEIRMLLTVHSFAKAYVQTLVWSLIEEDGFTFLEINSDKNLAADLHLSTERICNYLVDYAYNQTTDKERATFVNGQGILASSPADKALASNEQDEGSAVVGCLVLLLIIIVAIYLLWGFIAWITT